MPFLVDHGLDALGEADDIGVVALEQGLVPLVGDTDHVDSTNGPRLRTDAVEEGDDLLLVGDCHVQSSQVRILVQDLGKIVDIRDLEVLVTGIDALISNLNEAVGAEA